MILITLLSMITALLVITSTSTVYSVLWLVSTFLIVSALLGLLNLGFTALLYIIVYVGAIAILFLFVVQLLDLGSISEQPRFFSSPGSWWANDKNESNENVDFYKTNDTKYKEISNTSVSWILALIISIALLSIIVLANMESDALGGNLNIFSAFYNMQDVDSTLSPITLVSISKDIAPIQGSTPQVLSIAEWLYGPGLLPLVIISIILLVAMIAPISLCKEND